MKFERTGLRSYKRLSKLVLDESFEPLVSWGMRMAVAGTVPILWGLASGRLADAVWITLTAEGISWVEMKGSFAWRVRTLLSAAALAIIFCAVGTLTAGNIWLSVAGMFGVGFLATLLKNIGDRASGLSICVYLLYIITNAYPVSGQDEFIHRLQLVAIGAAWPMLVGIGASLTMPAEEPFRRQIAHIWRSISLLVETISRSGGKQDITGAVYRKEKDVRTAIDNSYQFYGRMAHQVNKADNQQYQLALVRKNAGVVAINVMAMGEEMEHINITQLDEALRIKAATLYNAIKEAASRIGIYVITLNTEEKLIALSHIARLRKLIQLIKQYPLPPGEKQTNAINRILLLAERTAKLLDSAVQRIDLMGNDVPVFRSYSLIKTLFILKPRYLLRNLKTVFNLNTFNTRFALRSAFAATLALFIFKWFNIDHGYWLPFSVMIVIQPYFGSTLRKALDRIIGTVVGGIAGSLLLHLPANLHINEIVLFLTFVFMVYFVRKNYAVAAAMITLNLVLLFNIEETYNNMLMVTRALCTVGGAFLAVASMFAFLPTWDRKWLPSHLTAAIQCNYEYFFVTFFSSSRVATWTKYKRGVETKNSNVFDSFNRYMQEPGKEKSAFYYDLIMYNVRVTRNLNYIHSEQDEKQAPNETATAKQQSKINECLRIFHAVLDQLHNLDTGSKAKYTQPAGWDCNTLPAK
jgi:hypothetical protein